MRSKFTTESCWATSRSWPRPVAWRWTIAARIPIAVWSPAPVSARPPMALVGGPSGEPVILAALVGQRGAALLAGGRLDLDDISAEPREHLRGARSRLVLRQIENANPIESLRH